MTSCSDENDPNSLLAPPCPPLRPVRSGRRQAASRRRDQPCAASRPTRSASLARAPAAALALGSRRCRCRLRLLLLFVGRLRWFAARLGRLAGIVPGVRKVGTGVPADAGLAA